MALRLLSAIGGILVFLGSAVFTAGTALAAPIGILVGRRLAARKGRPFTVFGSWVSAAVASSIAVLLAFALVVVLTPAAEWREMQDAVATAQAQDTTPLPEWMTRVFPQAAKPDPVTQKVVGSPAFTIYFGIMGVVIASTFFGAIAGSAGWLGTFLLRYAWRGRGIA